MLSFKEVELDDKPLIKPFLEQQNYRASEFCFTNLCCWGIKYQTQFAIHDDWLLIRFKDDDNRLSYLKPLGKGNLKEAIEIVMDDASQLGIPFRLSSVTPRMLKEIEAVMPGVFRKVPNRKIFDYIYTSDKLILLKGKKLQSKRNYVNRFKKRDNWEYKSLTDNPDLVNECKQMLEKWMEEKGEDSDPSLRFDHHATRMMLDNFEYLELRGGAVYREGQMIAFSVGSKLTHDTLDVHVEKAMSDDVSGAYAIINQQFVKHEASDFTYINREEDMGLKSLRRAKLSYRPDILLEKYTLRLKGK